MDQDDRRINIRRMDDLDSKYTNLEKSLEGIKIEHQSIKNLISSTAAVHQAQNKVIETKIEHMQTTLTAGIARTEDKIKEHDGDIVELRALANKVLGSLATLNWIGFAAIIMGAVAFVKIMFFGKQ